MRPRASSRNYRMHLRVDRLKTGLEMHTFEEFTHDCTREASWSVCIVYDRLIVLFPPSRVAIVVDRRNPLATFTSAFLFISASKLNNAIFGAELSALCSRSLAKDAMRLGASRIQGSTVTRLASANNTQAGTSQLLLAPSLILTKPTACDVRGGYAG